MINKLNDMNTASLLEQANDGVTELTPTNLASPLMNAPVAMPEQTAQPEASPSPVAAKSPEPEPPVQQVQALENDTLYWKDLYVGNASGVPDKVARMCGAHDASLSAEEREYRICSAINRSWYVNHQGGSREQVLRSWPQLRRRLADELNVADDEHEIYMAISAKYDEKHIKETAAEAYRLAYRAGLDNEQNADVSELRKRIPREYHAGLDVLVANAYEEGQQIYDRYDSLSDTLSGGIKAIVALEDDYISAPAFLGSSPELLEAVDELADMPKKERELVFYYAVKKSRAEREDEGEDDEDEGVLSRAQRAYQRGIVNIGSSIWEAFGYHSASVMEGVGDYIGGDVGEFISQSGEGLEKRVMIMREIKQAAQHEVLPLERVDSSLAESLFLTAAESAPTAIVSCTGLSGILTLTTSAIGESVGSARLRSPDSNLNAQLGAGTVSGAVQGSIYIGLNRLGSRMLERTINAFMKKKGLGAQVFSWGAVQTTSKAAVDGVGMFVAGKAASGADLLLQDLASQASSVDSGIDWSQYAASLTDEDVNMREAAAILPFLLIGSGRASLSHLRAPERLIGDGERLATFGIPESKIIDIMNERDVAKRDVMLREALVASPWWNDPGFIYEATRSLRLLNSEHFKGFERPEIVREFLNLSAETSMMQRPEYPKRSFEDMLQTLDYAKRRFGMRSLRGPNRYKEAIALWDEWYVRSNISAPSTQTMSGMQRVMSVLSVGSYERVKRYLKDLTDSAKGVPKHIQNAGRYAPNAENERRVLLRDRAAEVQNLSYQFLMNINPLDTVLFRLQSVSQIRADAEKNRELFLDMVGRAVIRAGQGVPHEENMKKLSQEFMSYYIRKKYRNRGVNIRWLKEVPNDYLRKMDEYSRNPKDARFKEYPELSETYRIYLGMRTNAELFIDLIPMMEDFQTALSRGMTPAQAYALIIERELGYDSSKLRHFPHGELDYPVNKTPMESYSTLNAELCNKYMRLSGIEPEQSVGDDGQTYWRLRRPDGTYSRWHESLAFAMNDVAANASLTFMPLGQGVHEHWKNAILSDKVNLNELPLAGETQFSGYDQLCSYALRDLSHYWIESAPYFQPGLVPERIRHRVVRNKDYGDGLSPVYREYVENEGKLVFDIHSMATPYGMASARFYTYWKRALDAGVVPETQARDFLMTLGDGWLTNLKAVDPMADAKIRHAALARDMGNFSVCYFMMRVPQLPLPQSVKAWFGYAAFCPPEAPVEVMPKSVPLGDRHGGPVRWSNRRIATQMQELAPQVEQLREYFGENAAQYELVSEHLPRAMGMDVSRNREQSWGFLLCGEEALHAVSPVYWELLHSPEKGWELMPVTERESIRNYVTPFLAENPPPGQLPEQDAMSAAIANLDAMLRSNSDLHAYSLNGAAAEQLLVMELPMLPGMDIGFIEKPLYGQMPFYYPKGMRQRSGIMKADLSRYAEIDTPQAQHAIRFLDTLRRYPSSLPYVTDSGIWWNNMQYGGKAGKAPAGLEDYKPVRPLVRITKLLKEVDKLCLTKNAEYMNFCGVPIPRVTPEELSHPALTSMTIYRKVGGADAASQLTYFSRLMPGDPSAVDFGERHPYVVEVRDGVYLKEDALVKEPSKPVLTMQALPFYTKAKILNYTAETQQTLYDEAFLSTMNALYDIEKQGPEFMETRRSGDFSLQELLMRLYEDTNFSGGVIGNKSIHELNARELRALRLAADIISCLVAPRQPNHPVSMRAFERLQKTLRLLRRNEAYRDALEHTLFKSNQELKEKIINTVKP